MATTWEQVADAVRGKLAASTLLVTAGVKKVDDALGDPLTAPHVRVLGVVGWELLDRPNANQERWRVRIAGEVAVDHPDGMKRSRPVKTAIARAIQEEWRSGIKLGGLVDDSWFESWDDGLQDLEESGKDGFRFEIEADVTEYLTTARTA